MDNLLQKTKDLCRIYGIQPARSKGQNFLINENVYDSIIDASELKSDDVVLEVGPGLGFLTAKLAKKVKKVIAVELDDKLADVLKTGLGTGEVENVEVVNENILDINPIGLSATSPCQGEVNLNLLPLTKGERSHQAERGYKIVANLPYNITSVFLRKFLGETENKPVMMVLMLQKEVAERIVAKPGKMSMLAISVQFYADAEIMAVVPSKDFWPAPAVDSAVIKIKTKFGVETRLIASLRNVDEKSFFRLVKFGFTAKRKMLKNNLSAGYHIPQSEAEERIVKAGFNPKIRAQELSVDDWAKLLGEFGEIVV